MTKKGFVAPLVILIFTLFILLGLAGLYLVKSTVKTPKNIAGFSNLRAVSNNAGSKCEKFGFISEKDFLTDYQVKTGDTILSISKNVLRDPSRVNELIGLNKKTYPGLSLQNPFIEVGWVIKLPLEKIGVTSGELLATNGEVTGNESRSININVLGQNSLIYSLYIKDFTKYEGDMNIRKGDCIQAVIDSQSHSIYYIKNLGV